MHYLTFLVLFTVIPWESNGARRPGYNGEVGMATSPCTDYNYSMLSLFNLIKPFLIS